jgi:hypothetical protein
MGKSGLVTSRTIILRTVAKLSVMFLFCPILCIIVCFLQETQISNGTATLYYFSKIKMCTEAQNCSQNLQTPVDKNCGSYFYAVLGIRIRMFWASRIRIR